MSGLQEKTKSTFRKAVGAIRERLLKDLLQACIQRYSLSAKDRSKVQLNHRDAQQYERLSTWLNDPGRSHANRDEDLQELVKERAYTLTNRLVILMQLECRGLRNVKLISQGAEKSAFKTEQEFFVALTQGDDLGFGFILQQVWDQLALELPALFEYNEYHECIPVPGPTLLWLLAQLSDSELAEAWVDDTTLGWLYQYWNDPDRQAIDEKLNTTSGKVEAHEIAAKTQLFTERYMVEWLVQNSLGAQWLAICAKRGWIPKAQEKLTLLQSRREEWNRKIAIGEVAETVAMPVHGDETFWKFYVPQELAAETITAAPENLQKVKVLDPAMGSGHFLVYVFDFLWELYLDQARLLGEEYSKEQIITWILENNLHGIDIDNRAVQIGAAALYIKAQEKQLGYQIQKMNIVATDLGLGHLKKDDPAVVEFAEHLQNELGLHKSTSLSIVESLKGAEYLGSLLQVDVAIDKSIETTKLFGQDLAGTGTKEKIFEALRRFIHNHDNGADLGVRSLAEQLSKGFRLMEILGQKYDVVLGNPPYLSKGKVREEMEIMFIDDTSELYEAIFCKCIDKLRDQGQIAFISTHNFMFLERFAAFRKKLKRDGYINALAQLGVHTFRDVSMPRAVGCAMFSWRKSLKKGRGSFLRIGSGNIYFDPVFDNKTTFLVNQTKPFSVNELSLVKIDGSPIIYWWTKEFAEEYNKSKKITDLGNVAQGLITSNNDRFVRYFWEVTKTDIIIAPQENNECVQDDFIWAPYIKGANTRRWFQGLDEIVLWKKNGKEIKNYCRDGASKVSSRPQAISFYFKQGIAFSGIGTDGFLCRLRKYKSIFDNKGSSIFCENPEMMQVVLSSNLYGFIVQSLNPTVSNQVGDIGKLPVLNKIADYKKYLKRAEFLYDQLFTSTESTLEYTYQKLYPEKFEVDEASIRDEIDKELFQHFTADTVDAIYKEIGGSPFDFPQWNGQVASIPTDFSEQYQTGESIMELSQHYRLHPDSILQIKDHLKLVHTGQRKDAAFKNLSWAIGVLLGRFDAQTGGLVDMAQERLQEQNVTPDLSAPQAHQHGLLYLSSLDDYESIDRKQDFNFGPLCLKTLKDILVYKWGQPKANELWLEIMNALVLDCKTDWTPAQKSKKNLNEWIRLEAFGKHESLYENRPIYFPLVSDKKNFFIWVNIHQWTDGTLNSILANYLRPDLSVLESRIRRLREDRQSIEDKKILNAMEKEIADLDKLLEELKTFTDKITQLASKGPAPELQEIEAPYVMDLDDGVMVNSSALWELVLPLWKKPKEWWKSLSTPAGKKDFDWSHLAMRYWPNRVMEKVKKDPSLAIAHSDYGAFTGRDLFEELHPKAAEKWREQQNKQTSQEPALELGV